MTCCSAWPPSTLVTTKASTSDFRLSYWTRAIFWLFWRRSTPYPWRDAPQRSATATETTRPGCRPAVSRALISAPANCSDCKSYDPAALAELVALASEICFSSGHSLSLHSGKRRKDVEKPSAVSRIKDRKTSPDLPRVSRSRGPFLFVVARKWWKLIERIAARCWASFVPGVGAGAPSR